jgi:hypothetical protein
MIGIDGAIWWRGVLGCSGTLGINTKLKNNDRLLAPGFNSFQFCGIEWPWNETMMNRKKLSQESNLRHRKILIQKTKSQTTTTKHHSTEGNFPSIQCPFIPKLLNKPFPSLHTNINHQLACLLSTHLTEYRQGREIAHQMH